jgi:hypothetical protein
MDAVGEEEPGVLVDADDHHDRDGHSDDEPTKPQVEVQGGVHGILRCDPTGISGWEFGRILHG